MTAGGLTHLVGTIKTVTPPASLVVTGHNGTDHTFTTEARTKILLGGAAATFNQLQPGYKVTVSSDSHGHVHEVSARTS